MKQSTLLNDYLKVHHLEPATVKHTCRVFKHLTKVFGDFNVEDFKLQHIEEFQDWILKGNRRKATANSYVKTMRPVFKWAKRRELIRKDPFSNARLFKVPDPEIHTYEPEEIGSILRQCDIFWKVRVLLAVLCGLRRGEVLNLRVCDIDFDKETVRVRPRKGTKNTWPWNSKNSRPRTLPMRGKLPSLLVKIFNELPSGQPYICLKPDNYKMRIELHRKGLLTSECMILPHRAFNKTFRRILGNAGIEGTFHDLRKTCITEWANALPIKQTAELAGHSNIETTLKYYVKVNQQSLIDSARRLGVSLGATGLEPATS
jgi:integrase